MSQWLRLFATVSGLALAAPFWVGGIVPLVDLPQHLAVVAVLRHHGDPAWGFAPFFETEWGELTPYWTYYLVTYALSFVFALETASRIYLSLYALALPWAGIALCRAFGRSPWLGLLAGPLAFNTNLYLGFVSYCTGVLLAVWLISDFEDGRHRVRHALAAAVLFFTHIQAFVSYFAAAVLLAWTRPASARARAAALVPLLPSTVLLLLPWLYGQTLAPREGVAGRYAFGRATGLGAHFVRPDQALRELPAALAGAFQDRSDTLLLGVWLVLLLIAWWKRPHGRALLLFATALFAYFAAPAAIIGQWNIGARFLLPAALIAIPAAAASGTRAVVVGLLAAVLSLVTAVNAGWKHAAFDREAGAFDEVIDNVPRGARVMPLVFDNRGEVFRSWPYLHIGQYAMVRRGGMTSANLGRIGPFPIRLREPGTWPVVDAFRPQDFRWDVHGRAYEYFLVRGPAPGEAALFHAQAALVSARDKWMLYRRK